MSHDSHVEAYWDYYGDSEGCWCGEIASEEVIKSKYKEAVKKGYSYSYDKFLGDYL